MRRNCTDLAYKPAALIRFESETRTLLPNLQTRSIRVGEIVPADGLTTGWLYLASPDCAVTWDILTSQDRMDVHTYRRTGPASWSRVWLSSGAKINCQFAFGATQGTNPITGLTTGEDLTNQRIQWWFYPYSKNEAFETMDFAFGPNPFDDFPEIPANATVNVGYPPRLTRFLYLQTTQRFGVTLGRRYDAYASIQADNQAGFAVSPWTSVRVTNTADTPISLLGTWSNVGGSILNP